VGFPLFQGPGGGRPGDTAAGDVPAKKAFNSSMSKISHLKYFPVFGGNVTGILMGN